MSARERFRSSFLDTPACLVVALAKTEAFSKADQLSTLNNQLSTFDCPIRTTDQAREELWRAVSRDRTREIISFRSNGSTIQRVTRRQPDMENVHHWNVFAMMRAGNGSGRGLAVWFVPNQAITTSFSRLM